MAERQISLPEKLYLVLLSVAQQRGLSPANWIASQLPTAASEQQPLPNLLIGLIGTIDSQTQPTHSAKRTAFGDGLVAKLAKQGIRRP